MWVANNSLQHQSFKISMASLFALVLLTVSCQQSTLSGTLLEVASTAPEPCEEDSDILKPCDVQEAGLLVTENIGSDITSWQNSAATTSASAVIPDAYYKDKTIKFTDPNLLALNIKAGVSIFGVLGTADASMAQCTNPGMQSAQCLSTTGNFWFTVLNQSVNVTGATSVAVPSGYYDGTLSCNVVDTNLVGGNIKAGVSILGVLGSLSTTYASCTNDSRNVSECLTSGSKFVCNPNNITASNIRQGVSLCGVTGTYSGPPGSPACMEGQVNTNTCTTQGTGRYVTSIVGNSIFGVSGSLSVTIPLGYYNGTKTATISDTDLLASNIKNGVTIFGVAGNVTPVDGNSYPACSEVNINTNQCLTAINRYVTPTLGSAITSWSNASSTSTVEANISSGYYPSGITVNFSEPNLLPGNIKTGSSIFNVTGTYGTLVMASNAHHDPNSLTIEQQEETSTYVATNLPGTYREVPSISKDNDGEINSQITKVSRNTSTGAEWTTGVVRKVCGKGIATLDAKISDCATKHSTRPTWDAGLTGKISWNGEQKGNSGNGTWTLVTVYSSSLANGVTCNTTCKEVWRDDRTGLLWSDFVASGANWCVAAGNAEASDPSGYCNNTASGYPNAPWQPNYPTAQSWCSETGPTAMQEATGSGETWSSGTYSPSKGGMGKNSSPAVRWRLPTVYDYLQADINGLRFVIISSSSSGYTERTATTAAASNSGPYNDRRFSYVFSTANGSLAANGGDSSSWRYNGGSVRCVGR